MKLPAEDALAEERRAIVDTMASLPADHFDSGPTLCDGWAPRDVLAHCMGLDVHFAEYVKRPGRIGAANQAIVERFRPMPADELLERARDWPSRPGPYSRAGAWQLLGDNATHHQDVLRPAGRMRIIPPASADAILREGALLGARKLLHHRVVPTDGGRALGRGLVVGGTREALGLWLSGRTGIEAELEFGPAGSATS